MVLLAQHGNASAGPRPSWAGDVKSCEVKLLGTDEALVTDNQNGRQPWTAGGTGLESLARPAVCGLEGDHNTQCKGEDEMLGQVIHTDGTMHEVREEVEEGGKVDGESH
eukprot:EG_transcript_30646